MKISNFDHLLQLFIFKPFAVSGVVVSSVVGSGVLSFSGVLSGPLVVVALLQM